MNTIKFFIFFLFIISFTACKEQSSAIPHQQQSERSFSNAKTNGALLSTDFLNLDDLKSVVQIEHFDSYPGSGNLLHNKATVRLTHVSNNLSVTSILQEGISDLDMQAAKLGGLWSRVTLGLKVPYLVIKRNDLFRVYFLARRRGKFFGEGDIAFYDIAEKLLSNISDEDLSAASSENLSEKGYVNTFNHLTAQALLTSIFSERFTDFIADAHERGNMPELISGEFTEDQLVDRVKGPVDNYVDIINNEWGQELGKKLKKKYNISRKTLWTPGLLSNYLNDLQNYYSWALQIRFKPFISDDTFVIKLSEKLNKILDDEAESE